MIKLSLILLILSFAFTAQAQCQKKIDKSKVMLFIDTNWSDMEIASAQKAACLRGERLEVIPKNYKEMTPLVTAYDNAQKKFEDCAKKNNVNIWGQPAQVKCPTEFEDYTKTSAKIFDYKMNQKPIKDQLKEKLEALKKEQVKIKNVSISGHDGGGQFGGYKGNIGRQELNELMAQYPELNDVESLLLLGCYTGVQHEVSAWKGIFPEVKLIGGYDGSAPLSMRPQGHQYISDILTKEKVMLNLKNEATVDRSMKSLIKGLNGLNAAVYVNPVCEVDEDEGFYYASKLDRKFNKLELTECEKAMLEINKISIEYQKYESGELEPPADTGANGALRKIYDKVRTHEHCLQQGFNQSVISANSTLFLLFWHHLKKNFGHYYDKDMKEAEEVLSAINTEEVIVNLNKLIEDLQKQKETLEAELVESQQDPEGYKARLKAKRQELLKELSALESQEGFKELEERFYRNPNGEFTPEERKLLKDVFELTNKTTTSFNDINMLNYNQKEFQSIIKQRMASLDITIQRHQLQKTEIEKDPNYFKTVWSPTAENMNKKSRKEVMDNVHKIHSLMMTGGLTPKQTAAMSYIASTSEKHLRYFQNPFSWHEYTGNPEQIPDSQSFANYSSSVIGHGMDGFFGSYAGGYGSGGSVQIQQQQQPQH